MNFRGSPFQAFVCAARGTLGGAIIGLVTEYLTHNTIADSAAICACETATGCRTNVLVNCGASDRHGAVLMHGAWSGVHGGWSRAHGAWSGARGRWSVNSLQCHGRWQRSPFEFSLLSIQTSCFCNPHV